MTAMAHSLRTGIEDYLGRLEASQSDLLSLYRRKRIALAASDAAALRSMEAEETRLAERLKALVSERHQMLVRAAQFKYRDGSLSELADALGSGGAVRERLAASRRRATALRREGWVHWIVAKRSLTQTSSLLDLIATRGVTAPTYEKPALTRGGSFLDASA